MTKEIYEKAQFKCPVSGPRFEPETYQTRSRIVAHVTDKFYVYMK